MDISLESARHRREREALLAKLRDYEFGAVMNVGHDDNGTPTSEMIKQRIAGIKRRIAELDAKLAGEAKPSA